MGAYPIPIDSDISRLAVRLLEIEGQWHIMGIQDPMGIDMRHLVDTFLKYAQTFSGGGEDIERKIGHSLRVAITCDRLSTGHGDVDRPTMMLAGLCHDVGRFPQWAMHQSYSDARTQCDHGELGAMLLGDFSLMRELIKDDGHDGTRAETQDHVIEAVRWHNALSLPDSMEPKARAICDLLREADVIDILDLCGAGEIQPIHPAPSEVASPSVMEAIRHHLPVDRRVLVTDTDFVLARLGLAFILRTQKARHIAGTSGGLEAYISSVTPCSDEARRAIDEASNLALGWIRG